MGKLVGIFNPYWNSLGGGERYTAEFAQYCLSQNYKVDIFWPNSDLIDQIKERFGIDLEGAACNGNIFPLINKSGNLLTKFKILQNYDAVFWVSDGSIPWLWGKANFLHFQVPFTHIGGNRWINKLKLRKSEIICNSNFTKNVIDKSLGLKTKVIYPPVKMILPGVKKKVILSVGRFDNTLHNKHQDILIQVFNQIDFKEWRLILAGGLKEGKEKVEKLKEQANNNRIEFVINPDFKTLSQLYGEASIYWHAAGYSENLTVHPEFAEHFGMSTVEAMSAGGVPLAYKGGGQEEIIDDQKNGFLWTSIHELKQMTKYLTTHESERQDMAILARQRAEIFNQTQFALKWKHLI